MQNRILLAKLHPHVQCAAAIEKFVLFDEQLALYKGKRDPKVLKQNLRSKPVKHGFQTWAPCETSGHTFKWSF